LRTYTVSLGTVPIGPKIRQGDGRTPEGRYLIDRHNPLSGFHRALHVAYPSAAESARAQAGGYDPGGDATLTELKKLVTADISGLLRETLAGPGAVNGK
jgi:hypothetical protein